MIYRLKVAAIGLAVPLVAAAGLFSLTGKSKSFAAEVPSTWVRTCLPSSVPSERSFYDVQFSGDDNHGDWITTKQDRFLITSTYQCFDHEEYLWSIGENIRIVYDIQDIGKDIPCKITNERPVVCNIPYPP